MKNLNELYAEVMADEDLQKEFLEANQDGKIAEFLKAHDCEATLSEIEEFVKNSFGESGELSDDELDNVSAGKKCGTYYDDGRPVVAPRHVCGKWRCRYCGCAWNQAHDISKHQCSSSGNEGSWIPSNTCRECKHFLSTGFIFGMCTNPERFNN